MKYSLAIEFGSVNTCIYRRGEGLVLKEPTLVCAKLVDDKYEIICLGEEAKKMQGKTDDKTYIFSPVGEGIIKAPEYARILLEYFLNKVEVKKVFKENAIVCVSSTLNHKEKLEYLELFSSCHLKNVTLVPSIICATEMAGLDINGVHSIFAIHIGGTTTEMASINRNAIIKGATLELGGRSLDINTANMVADKYETIISIAAAQKLKEEISTLFENDTQNFEVLGTDETTGKPKRVIVTSEDIRQVIFPLMEQIILAIETSINTCAPEIAADIMSNGIYLSGGVSNIAGIDKYLRKVLDIDVKILSENDNAVILGAGRLLSNTKEINQIANNF